jgi:peptidoglycan/LPS O-acetylase OafA/YrhL
MKDEADSQTHNATESNSPDHARRQVQQPIRVRKLRTTSLISFFMLLTLAAFGGVVLREAPLRGTSIDDTVAALIFLATVAVLGAILSIAIAFFGKANWQEWPQVLMSGVLVGAIAAGLNLVRESSTLIIAIAAGACSLIMIAIATLSARERFRETGGEGPSEL